jgi:hypothetical protein
VEERIIKVIARPLGPPSHRTKLYARAGTINRLGSFRSTASGCERKAVAACIAKLAVQLARYDHVRKKACYLVARSDVITDNTSVLCGKLQDRAPLP